MSSLLLKPPLDPELSAILSKLPFTPTLTLVDIPRVRIFANRSLEDALHGRSGIKHDERIIEGPDGGKLRLSIFHPVLSDSADRGLHSAIYYTHGGGMIAGTRFLGITEILDWVTQFKIVCVAVEYRLPPEYRDPAPIKDCYAGLLWMVIPKSCTLMRRG
jgi:acetyl esterase/lipase